MKSRSGFTIIEVVVVIAVMGILSGLVVITFDRIRTEARDAARSSNANVISEGLEKFYEKNGSYPSVISIANFVPPNTGAAIGTKLGIPAASLLMPDMPNTTTNGIASGTTPVNNYIMYEASSTANNAGCQSNVIGSCDRYTLRYNEELTGTTKVIESRRK